MDWLEERWNRIAEEDPELYKVEREEHEKEREQILADERQNRKKAAELLLLPTYKLIEEQLNTASEETLQQYYRTLNVLRNDIRYKYNQLLRKNLYDVSETTLQEVIQRTSWDEVRQALVLVMEEGEKVESYQPMWDKLQTLTPTVNEEQDVIVLRKASDSHSNSEDDFYDVVIKKPMSMEEYACEFERWEDWLGYYCSQTDLDKHGDARFIAHCLYEMTFSGFTQEEMQEEVDELVRRIESINIEKENKDR